MIQGELRDTNLRAWAGETGERDVSLMVTTIC